MRILALETSTEYCSCALSINGETRASHVLAGQSHSDLLLPAVARLMADAGLAFSRLDAIAFGAGPGSFTGLRIACGVAQGLAFAHDLPVAAVASTEALAEGAARDHAATRVITAFDARMGELYLAAYERVEGAGGSRPDWRELMAPQLAWPDALPALPALPAQADWFGAGSGFAAYGAALLARYAPLQIDAACVPHAAAVAAIGARRAACGETVAAEHAAPLYVRNKVALDVREQAALRAANALRVALATVKAAA